VVERLRQFGRGVRGACDLELAIANYKKSLELNPKNDNGAERLKRLEAPAQPKPDAATLDKYLGTYELRPGFNITFTREGDKLFSQATGQPKFEMAADSPTEFHPLAFGARIVFATDGSSLTLYQGGRENRGETRCWKVTRLTSGRVAKPAASCGKSPMSAKLRITSRVSRPAARSLPLRSPPPSR
jgi:hypothetical protein